MDAAEDQTAAKEISSEVESSTEAKQQSSKDKNESEIHADISAEPKSSSQPGFPILGGFEKKTVQKVGNTNSKDNLMLCSHM